MNDAFRAAVALCAAESKATPRREKRIMNEEINE
jgi:hypothetical protein